MAVVAGTAAAAAVFVAAMGRRNRRIRRRPVTDAVGQPYPVRSFRFSDGECVELLVTGRGPAVLLLPGADGIKETFAAQVPVLARSHRVLAPDLRARFAPGDGFDRLVLDAVEILGELGEESAVVVGQSLGGAIAMRLAALYPERVRGLVLANTLARVSYAHVGLNRTALVPLAMFTTRYLPTGLARLAARGWSRLEVWIFERSSGAERVIDYALWTGPRPTPPTVSRRRVKRLEPLDLRPQLPSLRVPTLVIKGPRDSYTPPEWAQEIAALIPGAEYREVPGAGHCAHVSMPGAFNGILLEWLEARRPQAAGDGRAAGDPTAPRGEEVGA